MRSSFLRLATPIVLAALAVAGVGSVAEAAPTKATATTACDFSTFDRAVQHTGSGMELRPTMTAQQATRHSCFDRVVITFAGAVPYTVARFDKRYADKPAGLWVDVWGTAPVDPAAKALPALPLQGFRSIQAVKPQKLGFDSGVAQVLVQTKGDLPFRMSVLAGPGTGSRLVIDVAHP